MTRTVAALILLLGLIWPLVGHAQEPLPRAVVEKYLFLPDSDVYRIGDRTYRWDSDLLVILYREDERPLLERLAAEINDSLAMGERRVFLLPPISVLNEGGYDRPNLTLAVNSDFFEFQMAHGPLVGLEDYQPHARAVGCYALPSVPLRDQDYVIAEASILVRDDLSDGLLADCLFRGLLLASGLMYTPALAFDAEPMSAAQRAEALAVLRLLYHPSVEPGMTREAFFKVLEEESLITD